MTVCDVAVVRRHAVTAAMFRLFHVVTGTYFSGESNMQLSRLEPVKPVILRPENSIYIKPDSWITRTEESRWRWLSRRNHDSVILSATDHTYLHLSCSSRAAAFACHLSPVCGFREVTRQKLTESYSWRHSCSCKMSLTGD